MPIASRRGFTALVLLIGGIVLAIGPARAQEKLPLVSETNVHRVDVVDAANGTPKIGAPEFAYREGNQVNWFTSAENCGFHTTNRQKYPDVDAGMQLAFFGADIVARFPNGVHNPLLGKVAAGTSVYTTYHGAMFGFSSYANFAAFEMNPEKYMLPAGGYCLRAMSGDNVVPGDPNNVFWIASARTWSVYGSPNGPAAMAKMTPAQQRDVLRLAVQNYRRKTGLENPDTSGNMASLR